VISSSNRRPRRVGACVFHKVIAVLCASDDYPSACATLGLEPTPGGHGLVLGQDDGARWTQVTAGGGADLVRSVLSVWASGLEAGRGLPPGEVVAVRPGCPVDCTLGIAGLPEPHDSPEPPLGTVGQ
jgi:hypothetical protein